MPISVKHIPASQRRHYRVTAPIVLSVGGVDYRASNWSISGFCLSGIKTKPPVPGILHVKVKIPFQGFEVGFDAKARIVRYHGGSGELAAEFLDLNAREAQALQSFIRGMISGEMESVDGVIRRLDMPVTPLSLAPVPETQLSVQGMEARRRRGMRFYQIAGIMLTVLLAAVIYTNFFQMKVTTAMVTGNNEVIVAPAAGDVAFMAPANQAIPAGAPIITLTDPRLEQDIKLAELQVQDANVELDRLTSVQGLEKERMKSAGEILYREWTAAAGNVKSLQKNLAVKQATLKRTQALAARGMVANLMLEKTQSEAMETERELNEASQNESKLAQQYRTVRNGFQVSDQTVQTGVADIDAMRRAADERLSIARSGLDFLKARKNSLSITAPAGGRLVRVFVPQGASAKYGDPIAVFERDGARRIQAFLTQDEALRVTAGQTARVYVSSQWASLPAKVTDIDYYSLTLNRTQGRFEWQNLSDATFKTVIVTLEPQNNEAAQAMRKISPGTASTVIF